MTVGARIKQAREARGLSRTQLAAAAGIPYPTLAGIENGDQSGSTRLPSLATALRVRPEWLETGKGAMDAGEMAVQSQSQPQRLDPEIVREVVLILQKLYKDELHRDYVITEQPELFTDLYQRTIERGSTEGNLFWLGTRVRRDTMQGVGSEQGKNVDDRGHRKRDA